ncbi:NAD(+) synthase [Candidatus Kapabacteria bacterium]|nr:NAD(+) synthase [Candidatus Kapabacteria bacterium]
MTINYKSLGYIRVAAVSSQIKVADIDFNISEIKSIAKKMNNEESSIICFQELTISSYSCADLFFNNDLIDSCLKGLLELKEFSKQIDSSIIVGLPIKLGNCLYNSAAVISNGSIDGIILKSYLPNYNEFYEDRWFSPALEFENTLIKIENELIQIGTNLIFEKDGLKFGVEICEDLWATIPPSSKMSLDGAELIFNLSAGNELLGKSEYRRNLVANQSARTITGYIYCGANPSESSTDVVNSGHLITSDNGRIISENRNFNFETDYIITDFDVQKLRKERLVNKTFSNNSENTKTIIINQSIQALSSIKCNPNKFPFIPSESEKQLETYEEILRIQSTALAKRLKHIGLKNVTIGISGGLDSTLALIVTIKAFEKLNLDLKGIHALLLPGPGSSKSIQSRAVKLTDAFRVKQVTIEITKAVEMHLKDISHENHNYDITYENSQARERTQILMDYANKVNGITIGTGDLSELALGWCTYNADQVSMYGVNSGVPKTLIKHLISYYANSISDLNLKRLLLEIIDQPISPELLPSDGDTVKHLTEEIVGPYSLNDFFLYYFIKYQFSVKKIFYLAKIAFNDEFDSSTIIKWLENFITRFINNQFKRSLMPDGVKVGSVSLSPRSDWRMPSDASSNLWLKEIKELKKDLLR